MTSSSSSEVKPIDEEIRCLLNKLIDSTGPVWDGSVILRLKETLETHYYKTLTHGIHYRSILSTTTLIRAIDVLVSADCFDEHDQSNDFALELHLRCVVAALRLLKLHGSYNCSRALNFDLLEKLYNVLSQWAQHHCRQAWKGYGIKLKYSLENYNNEFLIVYARDLISAISTDRDLTIQAMTKVAAGITFSQPPYANTRIELPNSLKSAFQRRLSPSSWHEEYRSIEDFVMYLRLFRERTKEGENKGLIREPVDGLKSFSENADLTFLNLLEVLLQADVQRSNSVGETFEIGTLPALASEANRNSRDVIETAPIARTGHFAYALLDLLQQNIVVFGPDRFNILVDLGLSVAKNSQNSFLRLKALEVLLSIGKLDGVGVVKVESYIEKALKDDIRSGKFKKVVSKWPSVKKRAEEMGSFRGQLSSVTVFFNQRDVALKRLGPLEGLIKSLEEELVCPIAPSIGDNVFQLIPCGHCHSRLAWMSSQTLEHNFCTVCNARIESIGPPLPVGKIGQILEELNNESKKLESRAEDSTYAASIMSYASSRASITERRPSLPRSFDTHHSLRERIQEFPTRLFKRSDSARSDHSGTRRSSISTDEQRLLLRVSSEASEIRGIPRNNLADLGVFVRNRIKPLGTPQSSYQTTAVSSSCKRIALVGLADFTIYDVSTSLEISIVCWGDITQRYAPQPKTAIAQKGPGSYYKSALTDDILAIASFETFIDIRNARSGQRINQLRLERGTCRTIGFSPDSQRLVIGLDNGDVLVYQTGIKIDFAEPPVAVGTDSPITSIVFSHDSLLMAVCTQDNIVRAYRLGNLSDGFFEQFVEPSVYVFLAECSISDSHSLFIVAKKKMAYPVIITRITSPREDQRAHVLSNARLEDEDYRVACYPKSNMLAAAIITCSGEFLLTYLNPNGNNVVWAVSYHTERLDLEAGDKESGFCSIAFSETRALALDRRGNLLIMELVLT